MSTWNFPSIVFNCLFLQTGTNPNPMLFGKSVVDMDTMTCCK